jgi:hypothetical protein
MLELPSWLHETLAITGVLAAASWLIVRVVQIGRPRAPGCSRCEHAPEIPRNTGIRSKRLRVLG